MTLIEPFRQVTSKFDDALRVIQAQWAPDDPPNTVALALIGRTLALRHTEFSEMELSAIFASIEEILNTGTEAEQDAVATGLLESLLANCDGHPGVRARLLASAGPVALEYCWAWDAFTGF